MRITLEKLIIILQTFNPETKVDISDTDELDERTRLTLDFNKDIVPYIDLTKKLKTLKEPE